MKIISKILIILMSFIFFTSFLPTKYDKNFKNQKKNIDTITVLKPVVRIIADNNETFYIDSTLSILNQKLLENTTIELLSKKYFIFQGELPQINYDNYKILINELNSSSKTLERISFDSVLENEKNIFKSRYALLIVLLSKINPDYPPHYNLTAGMASNTIIIAPHTKPRSVMQLLIIDSYSNDVVLYDQKETSNFDPRLQEEIEHITKLLLKKVYYK